MILVALLQAALRPEVHLFGASPNLTLLFTVSWVLLRGRREGMFIGLVGGIVLDGLSGAPFGISTLALAVVGYLAGVGEINIFRTARFLPYITIALASLLYEGLFLFFLRATGRPIAWGAALTHVILPTMLINILCMPLVYGLALLMRSRLPPQTVEWQ